MPTETPAPARTCAFISGVSSKRRKCTEEVFSSFSRSRSSSAIAQTRTPSATRTQHRSSTLLSAARRTRRSSASGNSSRNVTFQLLPSGISGLYASSSSWMPCASKMRSTRSISCTWYWIVTWSSKHQVAFGPTWTMRSRLCSSTLLRNSLRPAEYCSRLIRLARVSRGMGSPSDTVGHAQQLERMRRRPCPTGIGFARIGLLEPRFDLVPRHRTVARVEVRARVGDPPHDGAADLHRYVAVLALHAVGSVVARAAFDRLHLGFRNE